MVDNSTIIPASADRSEGWFRLFLKYFRRFSHIQLSPNSVSWKKRIFHTRTTRCMHPCNAGKLPLTCFFTNSFFVVFFCNSAWPGPKPGPGPSQARAQAGPRPKPGPGTSRAWAQAGLLARMLTGLREQTQALLEDYSYGRTLKLHPPPLWWMSSRRTPTNLFEVVWSGLTWFEVVWTFGFSSYTLQYNPIQCTTIRQYDTIQYNTIQYNRIRSLFPTRRLHLKGVGPGFSLSGRAFRPFTRGRSKRDRRILLS